MEKKRWNRCQQSPIQNVISYFEITLLNCIIYHKVFCSLLLNLIKWQFQILHTSKNHGRSCKDGVHCEAILIWY